MKRVVAYVDGFNVYSGLASAIKNNPELLRHNKVDLWCLIENHMLHECETLEAVRWYSAIPAENWRDFTQREKVARHNKYWRDLEKSGVSARISGFKKRISKCKHCQRTIKEPQEKESDNRCSLEMWEDAIFDRMDRALLFSSDSDFIPALHSLKRYSKVRNVDAVICPPVGRERSAKAILETNKELFGNIPRYTRLKDLDSSLF